MSGWFVGGVGVCVGVGVVILVVVVVNVGADCSRARPIEHGFKEISVAPGAVDLHKADQRIQIRDVLVVLSRFDAGFFVEVRERFDRRDAR